MTWCLQYRRFFVMEFGSLSPGGGITCSFTLIPRICSISPESINNAHTGAIRWLSIGSYSITYVLHPFFLNSNILFSECSFLSELLGALGGVTCLKYPFMIGRGRSYQVILALIENFFALHNAFSHFLSPCQIDCINSLGHKTAGTPGNIFSALLFFCWVGL
jgi:hypothetical protein